MIVIYTLICSQCLDGLGIITMPEELIQLVLVLGAVEGILVGVVGLEGDGYELKYGLLARECGVLDALVPQLSEHPDDDVTEMLL